MQIYKIIFYLPKKSSPSPIFIYRVHSDFGMMKLEIESDKVDDAEEFCASKTYTRRTPAFPSEERQGQSGSVSGHHVWGREDIISIREITAQAQGEEPFPQLVPELRSPIPANAPTRSLFRSLSPQGKGESPGFHLPSPASPLKGRGELFFGICNPDVIKKRICNPQVFQLRDKKRLVTSTSL